MVQILSNMIRPVVWSLLLAILVGTISTLSSISLMGLSAWLIASAALQPPLYVLSLAIVGVRFCGVMRAVFRYLERYFTHKVGFSLFTSFRVFVLTKIIKALPFKQQTENGDAFDLIVNAVDNLRDSFLRFFLPPIITTISVFILSIWFFIYSFFGWAMECIVIRKQLGYWENRGFVKLPFCVIYGFGVFIAFHIFAPIEGNYTALYVAGAICATIFEYMTARLMQKLFGEVWWNYDHLRFNYKGIICLQSTLGWGLLAVLIFSVFNKMVERVVFSMDMRVTTVLSIVLVISYVVDFSYHFTKRIANKKMESVVAQASSAGSLQRFFHR